MKLTKQQEMRAMEAYNAYWDNYLKGNVEAMASLLSSKYTQVGSAETEVFSNKKDAVKFLHDTIDQVAGKLDMRNRSVKLEKQSTFLLFHELCDLYAQAEHEWIFYSKFRATTIMEEKKHGWKIIHQHSSFPDARTGDGENVAIDKIAEENRELREAVKRRTIELEQINRELEIETSLEKVRASAMSMHKSDDLLDVCEVLYKELNKLGFDEMRNAMVNIHNDENKTFLNYDYSHEIGKSKTLLNFDTHPVMEKQIMQSRIANDAFSEAVYEGKDLEDWKEFRRKYGEKDDPRIDKLNVLYYYFYSIGSGTIGISTFAQINEEKLTLLKRFRNVFSLAYQRYSDIALAEAQAREAQIELALERVRARTMAMQKSEELKEVIRVVYDQFVHLKINVDHAGFVVDYIPKGDWHFWIADEQDIPSKITHPYFESVWASQFNEAKEKGADFFTTNLNFEEKNKFYNQLLSYVLGLPKASKDFYLSCPGLAASTALFDNVSLYIENFSGIPYTDEENNTLMRFGKVFQQTYTRFLDLQKAEAQAREAQIEASLEKVRSVAMSMNKSKDLLSICEVSFKEFKKLGFDNIRNALIHIQYDEKKYFMDYDFSDLTGGAITKIEYGSHPIVEDYLEQIRSAKDAFYQGVIKEDQLEEWKDFRRSSGQIDDPRLDKATALYYYFFSIGIGDIGISTLKPIDESQIKILKRFRNVFDLAYRRFNDIALAEQQARETQIQLALERVRARTMAMHKSDELADTVFVLFQQFKELGIEPKMLTIGIINEQERVIEFWVTDWSGSGSKVNRKFKASIEEPILLSQIYACWKEQKKSIEIELSNKELQAWIDYRVKLSEIPDEKDYSTSKGYVVAANFSKGILSISSYEPQTPETVQLLERFAGVFDLTYTRFFDLQNAEAQAREAQIEAALERVRSKAMAMHKSEELLEVITVVSQQLLHLGFNFNNVSFGINSDSYDFDFWVAAPDMDSPFKIHLPYLESPVFNRLKNAQLNGQDFFVDSFSPAETKEWMHHLLSNNDIPEFTPLIRKFLLTRTGFVRSAVLLKNIFLFLINYDGIPYSDKENEIIVRFAKAFEQAYIRFLDLQKAEAQARETQIEAALERVRAKAMAMHTSNDLSDTMGVLFTELPKLGINSLRCGVVLLSRDSLRGVFYAAASTPESDSFTMIGAGDMDDHPVFMKQHEHWLKNENYFTSLSNEELESYYKALFARLSIPYTPREHKVKTEHGYYFAFTEGMFYAWAEEPYSEEEINILNRFKAIIDLTFRRYLDLQKAEAQAREAKIEVSLERVRSKAMAMHSPKDLSETVNVFFKELKTLGIIPIRCGVGQIDEATRTTSLTTTTSSQQGDSFQVIGKVKQTGHPVLDGIFDHWKLQKEYFPVLEGRDIKAYYDVMNPQIGYPDYPEGVTQYGNSFPFKEGFVFAWTESKLSEEELQIFRRFTSVLSLTYRRYMDLKEAEGQAREAKIEASLEKVRSKTMAMQSSDELADTAAVVFQQLINLGIEPNRIYITIIKDEAGLCEFWITDEDGTKVSSAFKANLNENQSFKKMYAGWKQNKKSITIDMYGEELQEYFRHLSKLNVPFKDGLSQTRRMQYIAYFSKGFIGVASPDETKPETIQLLERFAAVFNLTYTRFNDLKQAEAQNKIIQAENERKTKELEEARQLQLAMLPKSIPEIQNLDIAVYMKTATEVGGDYYDFKVQENGVLNIGIGDATGHGLQAGTMITLMKGFFTSDVARFSPQKFLEHCNGMIRDIKLGRILMSFSHLRFNDNNLSISSAGMPPIYYHHKKNNRTEEIIIQGLPLGAMGSASYKLVEKQLNGGDTILLLTDGLPEQMNSHKVIFDYSRVLKYFDEIAENSPDDIIKNLVKKSDEWMDGTAQTDDITFMVIRVK